MRTYITLAVPFFFVTNYVSANLVNSIKVDERTPTPCTCGIFLSGQFKKGSKEPPKGFPALTQEMETHFVNNAMGNRQCTNKCLEVVSLYS